MKVWFSKILTPFQGDLKENYLDETHGVKNNKMLVLIYNVIIITNKL